MLVRNGAWGWKSTDSRVPLPSLVHIQRVYHGMENEYDWKHCQTIYTVASDFTDTGKEKVPHKRPCDTLKSSV